MERSYCPTGYAAKIFRDRYSIHPAETWDEACNRVVSHVSMAERGDAIRTFGDAALEMLRKNTFMPAGRVWYGCGRAKAQLLNCFVIPTSDSREGWGKAISDMIIVTSTGGGVGMNCSSIRPRGTLIVGTGGEATGAVSMMTIVDAAGEVIKGGGGRRTALLFGLNISHGDIIEFLDKKNDGKELNNANISIIFDSDPEDFFELVRNDKTFDLTFKGSVVRTINASDLWRKVVENSLKTGEPGILNGYYANRMSNIWYVEPLVCTNPCGESWMTEDECCDLGSLVLPRFVSRRGVEWDSLRHTVEIAVRFLDDVLDVNVYPLKEIADKSKSTRRIGLGVMGLHDMLLLMDMSYNSPEALEFVDKLMKNIKNYAYEASTKLAAEKGSFPLFDAEKFLKSHFVKSLKPTIRNMIRERGIRNCSLLTIPPTGTTSMVCGVSAGIEPMFAPAYEQWHWEGDEKVRQVVVHPLLRQFVEEKRDTSHFQSAHELSLRDHFEMQRTCQMHVDNSISKTLNVPMNSITFDELSELYMEFLPELKGVTVYPDGSREDQPLKPLSIDEALKHVDEMGDDVAMTIDSCKNGSCDI